MGGRGLEWLGQRPLSLDRPMRDLICDLVCFAWQLASGRLDMLVREGDRWYLWGCTLAWRRSEDQHRQVKTLAAWQGCLSGFVLVNSNMFRREREGGTRLQHAGQRPKCAVLTRPHGPIFARGGGDVQSSGSAALIMSMAPHQPGTFHLGLAGFGWAALATLPAPIGVLCPAQSPSR